MSHTSANGTLHNTRALRKQAQEEEFFILLASHSTRDQLIQMTSFMDEQLYICPRRGTLFSCWLVDIKYTSICIALRWCFHIELLPETWHWDSHKSICSTIFSLTLRTASGELQFLASPVIWKNCHEMHHGSFLQKKELHEASFLRQNDDQCTQPCW